jgi:hypothetical protein
MSNQKISALTGATTPLAGTETLPVVQSGATNKVSVSDLTTGRNVSSLTLNSTAGSTFATTSGNVGIGTASPSVKLHIEGAGVGTVATLLVKNTSAAASTFSSIEAQSDSTAALWLRTYSLATTASGFGTALGGASLIGTTGAASTGMLIGTLTSDPLILGTNNIERMRINALGNQVNTGTISPQQATTAGAPTYVKGAMYFDTTLNKLRIGGATAWETVTSV